VGFAGPEKATVAKIEFDAKLIARGPGKAWVFLDFPVAVSKKLPTRGRVALRGTMNGFAFRISAFPTGDGTHQIAVNKALQAGARARPGDRVHMTIEVERAPPVVKVPEDLKAALRGSAKARENFEKLSYSHRKGYVDWIMGAKKPETRGRRLRQAVERLSKGKGYFF
jgi:hypothetical protein